MMHYFILFIKSLLNLKQSTKDFSKNILTKLNSFERKTLIYFILIVLVQIASNLAILKCLEVGFHWPYLFQF